MKPNFEDGISDAVLFFPQKTYSHLMPQEIALQTWKIQVKKCIVGYMNIFSASQFNMTCDSWSCANRAANRSYGVDFKFDMCGVIELTLINYLFSS